MERERAPVIAAIAALLRVRDQVDRELAALVPDFRSLGQEIPKAMDVMAAKDACKHEREVNDKTFGNAPHKICLNCGARRPGAVVE